LESDKYNDEKKIREFFRRVKEYISKVSLKTYVTILLEGIGLLANIIAILSYFGAINTPETSPNFYINNQEFFAWSTIAVTYTLGIILARMKRRWRRMFPMNQDSGNNFFEMLLFDRKDDYDWMMFKRNFSFTLVISFPIIFLYVRAIQASASSGTTSPWVSLFTTILICVPCTLLGMIVSAIFDNALSLYEGD
jgi:hypothetical protein